LELERGALLGIHVSQDLVDYILSMARDLRSQLDGGAFPHDEVIGRVRQFSMTTCGVGKMPFVGYFTKNLNAVDPKTYKARLQRTGWGLIGVGLITFSASVDVSTHGFSIPMTEMSKALGSTFLGKALF
jgi:gamma-glutamyl:cysteine ligase YbdK (ATP-grasp superfamily)